MSRASRGPRTVATALLAAVGFVLALGMAAVAQQAPSPTPPSAPTGAGAPATPVAEATPAAIPRTVAVERGGGPATLTSELETAIAAWTKAAPGLVSLTTDPKAASTLGYAAPALLGPDTLSLDLRVPGKDGVEIRVAAGAPQAHPTVLLHEVGVLLGIPEGGKGVMAFTVPATGAPDAPTSVDVQALRALRSYAREDLNHDGKVDFYDLVLFGQAFGSQGVNLPADFNGDGRVDRQDLALLEKAYTFSPPSQTAPSGTAPSTGVGPSSGPSTPSNGGTTTAPTGASQPPTNESPSTTNTPAPGGTGP